ncbi:hybrid sensor histidine kinase/response regulator [Sporomusa sp.]|uniref:hybrid sensor histidine kinase/response regulator n=1 Tax=Sporomusa sp. TaxID=2078658 RepID=UPI002CE7DFE5|nr:response regulator [Sporomusa sp.]HWR45558.1 response regulator [Sporomusa sp.]
MQILDRLYNYVNYLLKLNTLKSQLRFWGFMLVLLPCVSLMLVFTYYELQNTKREKIDNLQLMITMQHATIDKWFNERSSVIRDMTNWPVIKAQEPDIAAINDRIQQFLQSQDEFFNVGYINKDGITIVNPLAAPGRDVSDRLYYHVAKQGKEYISDVLIGRGAAAGQPVIVFSSPVFDEKGQFKGLIAGSVKLTTIDKIMQQFHFGRTGETYLVNQDGLMITESRFTDQMVKTGVIKDTSRLNLSINTEAFRLARQGQAGYAAYTDYRGHEVLGAYRWLNSRNWIIIGEVEQTEILEPFYREIGIMFVCFLTLMAASLPLSMVLANRLETPIRRLIAGADAMRTGDYSYRVEQSLIDGSVSEIRDLCNIFNYMAENISTKTETLNCANQALTEARDTALDASVAKSQFLANMSHEIRTPLNAILGMGDLLWDTSLTTEQEKYVRVSRSAGENLLNLINDILDISKVEAGHFSLDKVEFDLTDIVEKTCEILALRAHEKDIELSQYIAPGTPVNLVGDPARLRQIITNLVGNAVKFTESGEVVLEIKEGLQLQDGRLELSFIVRDTGIGIPLDKLDHIFERFTQVDASDTRKYGGTGLGLAISKHLIEMLGGSIWVESTLGAGSIFSFTALFDRGSEQARAGQLSIDCIKDQKVLIIDDNATNRLILRETLTAWGAQVDEVSSGQAGLAQLELASANDTPYSLVLLDGCMPEMDGFEVAAHIKAAPHIAGTTVMMLTSNARSGNIQRCTELGIAGYLVKPVKRSELRQSILNVLGRCQLPGASTLHDQQMTDERQQIPVKILLVEDSVDNRLLIESYLKKTSHQLDMAVNGEIAVAKFKLSRYDLVFMDMQMPVMDGYQATKAIRNWEREQGLERTPIVALTAYALQEDTAKTREMGCDAHLTKPIKKSVLLEAIARYAGGKQT